MTKYSNDRGLLDRAVRAWQGWQRFRTERRRNKRYTYGRQWDDIIDTPRGRMSEEEALRADGETPLANNMIRRTVRNVVGVWRNNSADLTPGPATPLSQEEQGRLETNWAMNRIGELNARTLEEFLISGMAIHRKWHGRRGGLRASWTDFVSPDSFFMETDCRDFRGWDLRLAGEVHDMDFETLCARFSDGSDSSMTRLRSLYGITDPHGMCTGATGDFGAEPPERFFDGGNGISGMCRVIEVWHRHSERAVTVHDPEAGTLRTLSGCGDGYTVSRLEKLNRERMAEGRPQLSWRSATHEVWRWSFLAPTGDVLAYGISPYAHGGHPFVVKAYPFIDGEIHSFVGDILDQQRYTNRLITLYDRALRASAKGVLLFPEHALTPGTDLRDVADQWSRADGVIMYTAKAGMPLPQQAGGLGAAVGIADLLRIQLQMMEDITGVNSALQGKLESSATSGTLYERQTRNALNSLRDLLDCFASFVTEGREKDISNLRQFGC